jgi:hypothetical protein
MPPEPAQLTPLFLKGDWEAEPLPFAEARHRYTAHFRRATIAHNLRAVADPFVGGSTTLAVVGNDLPNVADNGYPWATEFLPQWIDRGLTVRYMALAPSDQALVSLRLLSERFGEKFQVRRVRADLQRDALAANLAQQWKTFHFAVFENEPQLWLEMNHPAGQIVAEDCYYFDPSTARDFPLHASCLRRFNFMFDGFGEPVV